MDTNRRKFIKILLIGGTSFIAGKILGPVFSKFLEMSSSDKSTKNDSVTFRAVQDKKTFSVYDDLGEEIFQIDNSA